MIPDKLQVKVLAKGFDRALAPKVIVAFHRWITERALGEVLIDVADYRHVYQGPGITLVGLESTYHLDESDGQPGLVCFRRRNFASQRGALIDALERTFTACALLERDLSMEGRLFDAGTLEVNIADRTVGSFGASSPSSPSVGSNAKTFALDTFEVEVASTLSLLYPRSPRVELKDHSDSHFAALGELEHEPRAGLPGVRVHLDVAIPVGTVLKHLNSLHSALPS